MSATPGSVGRSWRTPAKHSLMSSLIGEEIGVVNRSRQFGRDCRAVWIDLTAGDAAPVDGSKWHDSCSPGILARHAAHPRNARPVDIFLHEIQAAAYDRLLGNLDEQLPGFGFERYGEGMWRVPDRNIVVVARNVTGQEAEVRSIRHGDAVFVFNDPNAVTDWAMRDTFAREIGERTPWFRSLSTMGCNPGGLKRLELEERQYWFEFPRSQERELPGYRDLLLAAIEGDDAQWAYLISTSALWRGKTEKVVSSAFRKVGRTVAMSWLRQDAADFDALKRKLFLTRAELSELKRMNAEMHEKGSTWVQPTLGSLSVNEGWLA